MGISEKDEPLLWDFIYWVRKRRPNAENAPVNDRTLEYVAQGIELFLQGKKNPWPQKRGMKPDPELMWDCYRLTNFPSDKDGPHLPQHCDEGGAYKIAGNRLGISPKTVLSHVADARKRLTTAEGLRGYDEWLTRREQKWWIYHTLILTNAGADTLSLSRKEVNTLVAKAKEARDTPRGERDYEEWLAQYERRDEQAKRKPLVFSTVSANHPSSIAEKERREAAGIRTGYTKAGSKRKKTDSISEQIIQNN
jgi:hypothetical protein